VYDGYNGSSTYTNIAGDFLDDDFLSGNYDPQRVGLFPSSDSMNDLFDDNTSDFELASDDTQEASNAEDYEATENTYAGYLMTDLQWGKLGTIVGVRYEYLVTEYEGNTVEYDDNEDLLPIQKVSDKNDAGFILPMIHFKYNVSENANIRLAWTNTYSKPDYFNLVPYRIISRPDEEIELGNPSLDPARSMNLDLLAEYYFSSIGIISAGVFYKKIDDFIYPSSFDFDKAPYVGFEAVQPVNGQDADLAGFEVALQRQLTFLPGFASGFGVYANYTYTWSEARLTSEDGDPREVSLPGQAADVANLALSYEKFGFSGRISLNYSGEFIDEIRESSASDRYYDKRTQFDVSLSQQINSNIQVFADLVNLTNEPLRYYNGVTSRPEQQEFYSFQAKVGVKLRL
jgi:TonB-dependent receptor